jgi:hypothetical protein
MIVDRDRLLVDLERTVSKAGDRKASLRIVANLLKESGGYRWVGLYDVDREGGVVRSIVWSGQSAPEYPTFPITKGLTGAAATLPTLIVFRSAIAFRSHSTALEFVGQASRPVFFRDLEFAYLQPSGR